MCSTRSSNCPQGQGCQAPADPVAEEAGLRAQAHDHRQIAGAAKTQMPQVEHRWHKGLTISSRATRWPEIEVSGIAAFARHVVDDVEHTEASAAGKLVMHEIQPARIRLCLDRIGARVPTARRRARRLRTVRPSSR